MFEILMSVAIFFVSILIYKENAKMKPKTNHKEQGSSNDSHEKSSVHKTRMAA